MPLACRKKGRWQSRVVFSLKLSEHSKVEAMETEGMDTRVGSLRLGTRIHGADVFLAMQGCQHVSTAFNLGKLSFSNCCIVFIFNVIPLLVGTTINLAIGL